MLFDIFTNKRAVANKYVEVLTLIYARDQQGEGVRNIISRAMTRTGIHKKKDTQVVGLQAKFHVFCVAAQAARG